MRETWKSRYGLILAAAGNAIGIGNLLRFPGQAAQNGGGAFILPYLVSLVVFGLPMMWIAWASGRYGGRFSHGTTPGIFHRMTRRPYAKYLGSIGLVIPIVFCFYYVYIEAWCLAYAYFSLTGRYEHAHLPTFLREFQGVLHSGNYFSSLDVALTFLLITLGLNACVLYRGIAGGIEWLAKIAMPLLFVFCVILSVRIFTLPDAKGSVMDGLAFLWNPSFSTLSDPGVWLAAAGQVFFTLSIGFGSLEVYASYLSKKDDVAVTGLTTAATNEFVEIIFGSIIIIPAAAVFFGAAAIPTIAAGGTFDIGMVSMPEILRATGSMQLFGTLWFLLLFFAAFTSSVAVSQPVMAFLQDEARLGRGAAAAVVAMLWLLGSVPVALFFRYGFLEELDFWAGTLGLVLFSVVEVILFGWVFGIDRGWRELHRGALMRVPRPFRFLMRYVTPAALMLILAGWVYSDVIVGGKLKPTPAVTLSILERSTLPGPVVSTRPSAGSAEAAEREALLQSLYRVVEAQQQDVKGWARIALLPEGGVEVVGLEADPALRRAWPEDRLQRLLELEDWRLEQPASGRVELGLLVEGLHRAPYIWLARGLILALTLMVLAMIHVIWRRKGRPRSSARDVLSMPPAEEEVGP